MTFVITIKFNGEYFTVLLPVIPRLLTYPSETVHSTDPTQATERLVIVLVSFLKAGFKREVLGTTILSNQWKGTFRSDRLK